MWRELRGALGSLARPFHLPYALSSYQSLSCCGSHVCGQDPWYNASCCLPMRKGSQARDILMEECWVLEWPRWEVGFITQDRKAVQREAEREGMIWIESLLCASIVFMALSHSTLSTTLWGRPDLVLISQKRK